MKELVFWALIQGLQLFLLLRSAITVASIANLQEDLINPHALAAKLNGYSVAETCVQTALTLILLITGHWRFAIGHAVLTAVCVRFILLNQHLIDPTSIHKGDVAKTRKRRHIIIMLIYMAFFILAGYRMVHSLMHAVLSPEAKLRVAELKKHPEFREHHWF